MKLKNKKKLEKIIVGNLCNAVLHEILAQSVEGDIREHYEKEVLNSFNVALKYRNELNCIEAIKIGLLKLFEGC